MLCVLASKIFGSACNKWLANKWQWKRCLVRACPKYWKRSNVWGSNFSNKTETVKYQHASFRRPVSYLYIDREHNLRLIALVQTLGTGSKCNVNCSLKFHNRGERHLGAIILLNATPEIHLPINKQDKSYCQYNKNKQTNIHTLVEDIL